MTRVAAEQLGFTHKFVPSHTNSHTRTLLLLHGTGGDENDLIPLSEILADDINLLSPRGKVLENGFPRFFRRLSEGVFDIEDLRFRTQELAEFTERASNLYGFDLDKVIAVGFSNGANIAASLLLLFPRLLAGAILIRPMMPISPEIRPDLEGVAVLILSGRDDTIVPPEQPDALANMLIRAGADVTISWQEAGHSFGPNEISQAARWLETVRP
jgi:phospholipase/carboxylesterase/glyoxalase family protein